jgi:hypothetical protein
VDGRDLIHPMTAADLVESACVVAIREREIDAEAKTSIWQCTSVEHVGRGWPNVDGAHCAPGRAPRRHLPRPPDRRARRAAAEGEDAAPVHQDRDLMPAPERIILDGFMYLLFRRNDGAVALEITDHRRNIVIEAHFPQEGWEEFKRDAVQLDVKDEVRISRGRAAPPRCLSERRY